MNSITIKKLIAEGENEHVEFKGGLTPPEMIANVVCAFLNTSGGRILIGIGDKGRITGVTDAGSLENQINNQLPELISPPAMWTVERISVDNRNVIVVDVPEGSDKPYLVKGAIYFRRADRTIHATRNEISALIQKRAESSQRWERQIAMGADLEDLETGLIRGTAVLAMEVKRWQGSPNDTEGFLHSHGLLLNGGVTNACLLLFGNKPSRLIPQARVRLLVMPEGKTGDTISVDRTFDMNLIRTIEEIESAFSAYVGGVSSTFSETSWQRTDRSLYPMSALREGVLNSVVHRDYSLNGTIIISITPDSLQIANPGGLPSGMTTADLKRDHLSMPRNPDIAHIFYLRGMIDKIGRGTQRILDDCRKAHLRDPKWQASTLETKLIFYSSATSSQPDQLNERQDKILNLLAEKKQLRAGDITKLVGGKITERTIRNDLQALVDGGWIVRKGRGRSTSYIEGKTKRK